MSSNNLNIQSYISTDYNIFFILSKSFFYTEFKAIESLNVSDRTKLNIQRSYDFCILRSQAEFVCSVSVYVCRLYLIRYVSVAL